MKRIIVRSISLILCVAMAAGMSGCSLMRDIVNGVNGSTVQTSEVDMSESNIKRYKDYIFVGDSRFVGMNNVLPAHTGVEVEVIAKTGQGLKWLKQTAPSLYGNKGKTIIFNLGVNDLHNASKYVEFYNSLPQDFMENNTLIFMTVNPVDEAVEAEHGYKVKNIDIENFNKKLRAELDPHFKMIDTNTYVQLKDDFRTTDGLHYYNNVYLYIFDYAIECCEKQKFVRR